LRGYSRSHETPIPRSRREPESTDGGDVVLAEPAAPHGVFIAYLCVEADVVFGAERPDTDLCVDVLLKIVRDLRDGRRCADANIDGAVNPSSMATRTECSIQTSTTTCGRTAVVR
jgi:hypothetical protein